jgi:release factor glutamine methyltransferase
MNESELWAWRRWAQTTATAHDLNAREVDWLLASISNLDRLALRLESNGNRQIELSLSLDRLTALWQERIDRRTPVQYLIGKTFWRDFELIVSPAVLIPRPETESIIDIAIAASTERQQERNWVDLGTGSGAIAIGLAKSLPQAHIYAIDLSVDALNIARTNAQRLNVSERIEFRQGDWWSPLAELRGRVAAMLSNPPYIPSTEVLQLQPEVVGHEPHLALDGGKDGLQALRILVDSASTYLEPGGLWLVEMMAGQGADVAELLAAHGSYTDIEIIHDLAGLDRFVLARLRSPAN